jgi:UPF0176 protein
MPSQVLLFYNYTQIADPTAELSRQQQFCEEHNLTGRMIIATEGLNATFEGDSEQVAQYQQWLHQDQRFADTHFKTSPGDGSSFPKLNIKVRPELVSLSLGAADIDPNQTTGHHLTAEQLHDWIHSDKEFYIIDMRNDYEFEVGHFAGSVLPNLENFRDLPKVLPEIAHLKNKTVVTVCTGGIRCEKASGYLVTQGFNDVHQLFGGIHTYMEKYPNQDFLGKLYVFDGRVTMGFNTDDESHQIIASCTHCGSKSDQIIDCADIHCLSSRKVRHFVCCDDCLDDNSESLCKKCRQKKS